MAIRKVPLQTPMIDSSGMINQQWAQFFMLIAKDVAGWQPPSFADADAPDNTVYYSTTGSKLTYKDSGGTPHALY